MRITHLITDLDSGGTEIMLYRLLSHMHHSSFQSSVVSMTDDGALGHKIQALGVPVFTLGMRHGVPNPLGLSRLLRLLRQQRPALLQTWLYHADLLGLLAGKLARVPAIVWNLRCSDMDMQHYSWTSTLVLRVLAALAVVPQAVLVNSEAGRQWHEKLGYNPRSWVHIPNGFDLSRFCPDEKARSRFRQSLALSSDSILIGLIARLDPMKDHSTFFKAAHLLLKNDSRVHFALVGSEISWENLQLSARTQSAEPDKHFHLLGEREDVPRIMAALDIATSSSSSEGFPNTIGEAMACEVPCVVTDVGDSAFLVSDTGKVVPPMDPEALAEGWQQMIELGEMGRRRLGAAARQRIKEHFNISAIVERYEKFYLESVGNVRHSRF
jgi:glycosyltransferase involved in cell wall biosynthesis